LACFTFAFSSSSIKRLSSASSRCALVNGALCCFKLLCFLRLFLGRCSVFPSVGETAVCPVSVSDPEFSLAWSILCSVAFSNYFNL